MSGILSTCFLDFGLLMVANAFSLPKPSENTESEIQTVVLAKTEEGSPNLRKILYPTYVREPFGTDFYT